MSKITNKNELKSILEDSENNKGFSPEINPNILTDTSNNGSEELNHIFHLDDESVSSFRISTNSDITLRLLSVEENIYIQELLLKYLETSGLKAKSELIPAVESLYRACITICVASTHNKIKRGTNLHEISNNAAISLGSLIESSAAVINAIYAKYIDFTQKFDALDNIDESSLDNLIYYIESNKVAIADLHFDEKVRLIEYLVKNRNSGL